MSDVDGLLDGPSVFRLHGERLSGDYGQFCFRDYLFPESRYADEAQEYARECHN